MTNLRHPADDAAAPDLRGVRAVAFDAYGTLFDYTIPHFRAEVTSILLEQQIEVDHEAFFTDWLKSYSRAGVWGEQGPTWEQPDSNLALNGPLPPWHSQWEIWRRQFGLALQAHGVTGDTDAAADRLRDVLSSCAAYPDAHDTVEALARSGYTLALLSNADEDFLQASLSRAQLRFSVIQSSESLRAYKPHRAIFEALCHRLGCAAGEVLYVGDSPVADVSGARNAGLRTAWVRRGESAYPEHAPRPDLVIDNLAGLRTYIQGLGNRT